MKSFATPDFWNAYADLPRKIQQEADKTYLIWRDNPQYPSLHFKKAKDNLWSVRITINYRALAIKRGNDYYWIWIGAHEQYDRLLK